MAGGVNPFGFSMGVLPAPRSPRQPQDLPSAPFGFAPKPSKMQQTLAILNEYNPLPAFERLLKSPMALGGPISERDIADGLTVAGTVTGGSAAAPKPKNALNMGIRAFHGSPHDFPPVRLIEMPDGQRLYQNMGELAETPQGARIIQEFPLGRFDLSKIGTGEGAQAYGHGLYFAENEGVARGYRDALAPAPNAAQEAAQRALQEFGGDTEAAANHIAKFIEENGSGMFPDTVEHYRSIETMLRNGSASPGRMYEVEINADPDTFLDWDKPLSEQPKSVQDALARIDADMWHPTGGDYDPTEAGQSIYQRVISVTDSNRDKLKSKYGEEALFKNPAELANKELGIPGIKYLDAGSRTPLQNDDLQNFARDLDRRITNAERDIQTLPDSAKAEYQSAIDGMKQERRAVQKKLEPTRNYVVFDDKLISIVRKYGIAGASAMLGYNILDGMDPAQAEELQRIEGK